MFYQILLFRPLKLWSRLGFFCFVFLLFFLRFTAFFSFSSSQEVEKGSLVSGHVCLGTPPEGAELADSDTNRFITCRVRDISLPPSSSQINGGRTVEPVGPVALADG